MRNVVELRDVPDVAQNAELVKIAGKGRGLRAARDLPRFSLVALSWPFVTAVADPQRDKSMTTSFQGTTLNLTDTVAMRAKAVRAAARDPLLASAVGALDDNDDVNSRSAETGAARPPRQLPLAPLHTFQQLLSVRFLPLLPQWAEYFPAHERGAPSAPFIERVCSVNAHGDDRQGPLGMTWSSLFPLVSLFNHSAQPSCELLPQEAVLANREAGSQSGGARAAGGFLAVLTKRAVRRGEELTLRYHDDAEVVSRKWGI